MGKRTILRTAVLAVCITVMHVEANSLPEKVEDGVMLHCHNWPLSAIENNLERIAAAGYNSIQVSPIQRIRQPDPNEISAQEPTGPWWLLYQPVSFKDIGNYKLGTEAEFKSLCDKAEQKGMKIIVDAVLNHVADTGKPVDQDSDLDEELRDLSLYHQNGSIGNYKDRWQVTQQKMGSLPDLNTQDQRVQDMHVSFLNKCIQLGADGFRFDAAKHIETSCGEDEDWCGDYWEDVLHRINNPGRLYLFGEVLQDEGDNLNVYLSYYDVTSHQYGGVLRDAVEKRDTGSLKWHITRLSGIDVSKCLAYVENHDDYEHNHSRQMDYWERKAANAFLISRAELTPCVLDRSEDDLWEDPDIAAVNHLRNYVAGTEEYIRFPSKHTAIVERGNTAAVIINLGHAISLDTETTLFDGTYVNRASTPCELTAADGRLTGTLPGGVIFASYPEQDGKTIFCAKYDAGWNHDLYLRGGTAPLSWSKGVKMEWRTGNLWTWETDSFSPGSSVEFKVLVDDKKWEVVDGDPFKNHAVSGCKKAAIEPIFPL